jgi:hypothetical protein
MNRFGGRFASGMKRELAVGDSPARFRSSSLGDSPAQYGSRGGRFTTLALISVSLSLTRSVFLSHSLSLVHSLPLTLSLSHSLTVSLSHSPAVWVTQLGRKLSPLRWRYQRFRATPASLFCWGRISLPQPN